MRITAALLLVVAACGDDAGDGVPDAPADIDAPTEPATATAQVTRYEYAFDLTTRAAHATVSLRVTAPGACLALAYAAPTPTAVRLDGIAQPTAIADRTLRVCADAAYAAGDTAVVETELILTPATLGPSQVGYSIKPDADGNDFHYLVSWVGGCSRFGPCDPSPGTFAQYRFAITHPESYTVRCSGTVTEPSATETHCDFALPGGPTYSTYGFAAYPAWTATSLGTWGSAPVTLYDRAATGIAAEIDTTYHAGFVAWMESTFGPYPYGDLRILTAPTYWAGFEHPGNIVLDDGLAAGAGTYNVAHTLNHELAHQWAGDETTLADTYDFVWKEAMAEYLSYVYEDETDPAAAARTLASWKSSGTPRYFLVPEEHPALFDYYGDVYGPGPMILFRQLEVLTSRAQVIAALQTVLGTERALSVDALVAALEASTGLDLDAYTSAWIRGTGAPPRPRIRTTFTRGATESTLAIEHPAGAQCGCKFAIALDGALAGERTLVEFDTFRDGPTQTKTIPTPAYEVTVTRFDPRSECLVGVAAVTAPAPIAPVRPPYLSQRGWDALQAFERGKLPR